MGVLGLGAVVSGIAGAVGGCTDRTIYVRIDRGVNFKDVRVGKGLAVEEGDFVEVHYTVSLPKGKRIIDTRENGRSHRFTVGDGSVLRGLDVSVRGMRSGGVREVHVLPDSHVGRSGYGGLIPPNTPLLFEVELLAVSQSPPPIRSPLTSTVR